MVALKLPAFKGNVKEDNGQISVDNTVFVLEREYAITNANNGRPVLMTAGILRCNGILFYDSSKKLGSLIHLLNPERFVQTTNEVLDHMKRYDGRRFQGYIVRCTEDQTIEQQLKETEGRLFEEGLLIKPFELFPEQTVVFDTRDGQFSKRPSGLYLPSIEDRPYGNRVIKERNISVYQSCVDELLL